VYSRGKDPYDATGSRTPVGSTGVIDTGAGGGAHGAPHWPQNLFSGEFEAPQLAHTESSRAPHSPQNRIASAFS
jgi:hypothetical protein